MWKKLLVMGITLLGTYFVIYAQQNELLAASNTYNAGGNVTGRVNKAPNNLSIGASNTSIGIQKGDKYYLTVKNPETGNDLGWIVLGLHNQSLNGNLNKIAITASTEAIGHSKTVNSVTSTYPTYNTLYNDTNIKSILHQFTQQINTNPNDAKLVQNRLMDGMEYIKKLTSTLNTWAGQSLRYNVEASNNFETGKVAYPLSFTYDISWVSGATNLPNNGRIDNPGAIAIKDITIGEAYWDSIQGGTEKNRNEGKWWVQNPDGSRGFADANAALGVRSALNVSLQDNVVFALSSGSNATLANVDDSVIPATYTNLYQTTLSKMHMKLRLENANLTNTTTLNQIIGENLNTLSKTSKDTIVYLDASAQAGSSSEGVNTVSAIFFDDKGNFKHYKPLEPAKGNGKYALDLTGVPLGKYQIGIVNEVYNETSTAPVDSSAISDVKELEIVPPLSNPVFTATSNLIFNSNANVGDSVGMISSANGVGNPVYTLVADPSHATDVTKFELGSDGKTVQVKGNALDAGTYYFKIQAQDSNGDPQTPLEISASITVAKGDITSIAFDNPNQTKKSISDAQTSWNETATSTPSNGVKVSYSLDSGNLNLLDINSATGAINLKTTTGFGKVVIKATADDDSATGKDNFNSKTITKDIIIYQGVDGVFTPDSASSDPTDPSFSASDPNVKGNGVIGSISGTKGTPDNLISGTITYTYTIKNEGDANYFSLSGSTLKVKNGFDLGVGSYTVLITVADTYGSKDISVNINVGMAAAEKLDFYDEANTIITNRGLSIPYGSKNIKVLAKGADQSNTNPIVYSIEDGSTNVVTVHSNSGALTIHGVGTTKVKATKAGMSGQAEASQTMNVTITKGDQVDFKFVDFAGSDVQLPTKVDGSYEEYKDPNTSKLVPYTKNGTFQLHTNGANGNVTYALKAGSESDVITVDGDGTIHITNATLKTKMNRVSVAATSIDTSGTYEDKTIEIVVNIDQGEQTLSFIDQPLMIPYGNNVSVMPMFNAQDISNDDGTVLDTDIYLDQSTITYTNGTANVQVDSNDGVTLKSNYTGLTGVDGTIEAIKDGNRNYKQVKITGTFHIMDPSENDFTISYPNEVFYGDTFGFTPRGDSASTNVAYEIIANEPDIANYNSTTKKANALKVGQASFTIKRSADGEVNKEKTVSIKVKPKEITITSNDKNRLVGEANPSFTYDDFTSQLVSWNGIQDVIQASDIQFSTTANTASPKGTYPIILNTSTLHVTYPNYTFKANPATLTITAESIDDTWYHMEVDDGTSYANTWTNQNVTIIADHVQYGEISSNKATWENELITSTEGNHEITFYMKKATGAISEAKTERIMIDKTAPKITSIKGVNATPTTFETMMNIVTFNTYFKPGMKVEIQANDVKPNVDIETSGIKSISYKIYEKDTMDEIEAKTDNSTGTLNFTIQTPGTYQVCAIANDHAGNASSETCEDIEVKKIDIDVDGDGENDFLDPDGDGCPDINIAWENADNTWTKLNTDRNHDNVPDLNIDSDGDGKSDINVDTDNDGKPDLNLINLTKENWKPTLCVTTQVEEYCTTPNLKAQVNVNIDKDQIPDINIDTNGDMKANINITKPNETKPYLNITSKHTTWKPEKDFTKDGFQYDTEATWKAILNVDSDGDGRPDLNIDFDDNGTPDINIDADGDGIPETDIDSDGDGKADINIDTNKDGKPDENIVEIKSWKPEKDASKDGFLYDTMSGIDGNDKLEDNDVSIEKPDGGVFLPNYALKVEKVTESVNEVIKKDIIAKANGQVIKEVFDVKLMDGNVQIQPDGKLRIKLPMPSDILNPRLVVQQADGTYEYVVPELKDGYLIYESDYLGIVSIVGDHEEPKLPDKDINIPDTGGSIDHDTSVKGTYTGSNTSDMTNVVVYISLISLAGLVLVILRKLTKIE